MKSSLAAAFPALVALLVMACAPAGEGPATKSLDDLAYVTELPLGFDEAIERVTDALKVEQFGIVSRIDLHTTFKQKLGVDMEPHAILGACNPKLAHQAVTALPETSMMLPCNVTVQAVGERRTVVRIVNPQSLMADSGLEENPVVREIGREAEERLKRVARALGGAE